MMTKIGLCIGAFLLAFAGFAQEINFTEYNLNNGLHVILHQDNDAPVVAVGVMYHVGAKDEAPDRSGFAHFFEHLLFGGTKYIDKGDWYKIISSHGGFSNANTTQDRTYYYEVLPANNLKLALWMESERMLHPVIDQGGVNTQAKVVKEEKRMRIDNAPYGRLRYGEVINTYLFKNHPYKSTVIGTMEDVEAAKLSEFKAFFDKYYVPNNAVLVVAGDIDKQQAKAWIEAYFSEIPSGDTVPRVQVSEPPVNGPIKATEYDPNIRIPVKVLAYRTPGRSAHDTYVLNMISTLLTDGKSSWMHQALVDKQEIALAVLDLYRTYEDYGIYVIGALPMNNVPLDSLTKAMDAQIHRLKTELISEQEYQKLLNTMENRLANSYITQKNIANALAAFYIYYDGQTGLINKQLEAYKKITRQEIKEAANKYFTKNERLNLNYLPGSGAKNTKNKES